MAKELKIPLETVLEYLRDLHLTDFHKDTLFKEEDYHPLLKALRRKHERHQALASGPDLPPIEEVIDRHEEALWAIPHVCEVSAEFSTELKKMVIHVFIDGPLPNPEEVPKEFEGHPILYEQGSTPVAGDA